MGLDPLARAELAKQWLIDPTSGPANDLCERCSHAEPKKVPNRDLRAAPCATSTCFGRVTTLLVPPGSYVSVTMADLAPSAGSEGLS